jgi:hypothetical protein
MIVDDLDFCGPDGRPTKADAELVIHADAVLPGPIAFKQFQPIARRYAKVLQTAGDLQLSNFTPGDRLNVRKSPDPIALCQSFGVGTLERYDHLRDSNAMRDYYQVRSVTADLARAANSNCISNPL